MIDSDYFFVVSNERVKSSSLVRSPPRIRGLHTMLDEGLERCLDLIHETAAINALMIYGFQWGSESMGP
jgi:hypothetical protein